MRPPCDSVGQGNVKELKQPCASRAIPWHQEPSTNVRSCLWCGVCAMNDAPGRAFADPTLPPRIFARGLAMGMAEAGTWRVGR